MRHFNTLTQEKDRNFFYYSIESRYEDFDLRNVGTLIDKRSPDGSCTVKEDFETGIYKIPL